MTAKKLRHSSTEKCKEILRSLVQESHGKNCSEPSFMSYIHDNPMF